MIKMKITYSSEQEREKTLRILRRGFEIIKISKEYRGKAPSKYASLYLDVKPL